MAKGGRPLMEGVVRYANKRINYNETQKRLAGESKVAAENDTAPPSPRIKRERELFNALCFKGGGQSQHAGDAIGQLWLVGRLDAPDMDDIRVLDIVRRWWRGREAVFAEVGHKTARYERASRSSNATTKATKLERDYYHYNGFLMDAAPNEQDALIELMTPEVDGVPREWVSRIVQTEILKRLLLPVCMLSGENDEARWERAWRAIRAMAGVEARTERNAA